MRKKIAKWLVRLAQKIYPENKDVAAFWTKYFSDIMITGSAFTTVDPEKVKIVLDDNKADCADYLDSLLKVQKYIEDRR